MISSKKLSILLLMSVLSVSNGMHVIKIEMEDMAMGTSSEENIFDRSEASEEKSLRIDPHDFFSMAFCLREQEVFLVSRIVYSNDGPASQVDVILNNDILGSFRTHTGSNFGHLWNEFHLTGAIGTPFILEPGGYNFTLAVVVGNAVEIDYVEFAFSLSTTKEQVLCINQEVPARVSEENNGGRQSNGENQAGEPGTVPQPVQQSDHEPVQQPAPQPVQQSDHEPVQQPAPQPVQQSDQELVQQPVQEHL